MSTRDVVSDQTQDEPAMSVSDQHGVTTRVSLDPDGRFVVVQSADVTPNDPEAERL